jgi:uncharacterized membrane protein
MDRITRIAPAPKLRLIAVLAVVAGLGALPTAARADLQLCSRMSYVIETAIGLEDKGAVATRGWFRIDPGQCRTVLQGALAAESVYVHARALPVYGASPLPQSGHADLCIATGNFVIAAARQCRSGQRPARFTAVRPTETDKGLTAHLAEEAEYSDEQARDAGIQRLLVMAGYDATPIDGIRGAKTDAALASFLQDHKLANTAAGQTDFFDLLLDAVQKPGSGFTWCNDSAFMVMAALGAEENGAVVTRGWYRVEPGKCLRPEIPGQARRLFSFAEAVDGNGQPVRRGDKPLAWGGDTVLCTREAKFELSEQKDCAGKGLNAAGFAAVDLARGGGTVRFRPP